MPSPHSYAKMQQKRKAEGKPESTLRDKVAPIRSFTKKVGQAIKKRIKA